MTSAADSELARALCVEQVQSHQRLVPLSLMLQIPLALLIASALLPRVAGGWLLGWLAAVVAAASGRFVLRQRHRLSRAADVEAPAWRRRYRVAMAAQGVAWASGAGLMLLVQPGPALDLMVIALVCVAAGNLMACGFDRMAAVAAAAPVAAALLLTAVRLPLATWPHSLLLALVLLPLATLVMQRAHRWLNHAVATQFRQDRRADELRAASRLIDRTGAIAGVGGWTLDARTRRLALSPHSLRLLGLPPTSTPAFGQWLELLAAGSPAPLAPLFDATLTTGAPLSAEITLRGDDQPDRVLRIDGQARIELGQVMGIDGALHDVTQQREAGRALADQQRRLEQSRRIFEAVINASADMISVIDERHVYHMVNDTWLRTTGKTREQVIGQRSTSLFPLTVRGARLDAVRDCLDRGQRVTVRRSESFDDQTPRLLHSDYYPIQVDVDGPRLVALVSRDMSHDEAQRLALEAAAEMLRGALDATGDAIFATDAVRGDEPPRFVNQQLLRMFHVPDPPAGSSDTLTLRQLGSAMYANAVDRQAEQDRAAAIIVGGVPVQDRVELRDGRVLSRRFAPVPMHGRTLRVWSFRDVTAEVRAIEAREQAAAEQRALFDNFPGCIEVLDARLHWRHVNDARARLFGRTPAQLIGHSPSEVLAEPAWRQLQEASERARAGNAVTVQTQHPGPSGDGPVELEVTYVAGPAQLDGTRSVYGFGVDVTERRRAQAALVGALAEAERARSTQSRFLSQMSHELRTPLNAIIGFGQLLAAQPLGLPQQQQAQEVLQAGRHLLGLIETLLALNPDDRRRADRPAGRPATDRETAWPAAAERAATAASGPRARALYIEDNPVNLMLMEAMLEDELDLVTEADPVRGLQVATATPPDLILLDIQLPVMDGFEVLRQLRADARTRHLPVVAVTANAMPDDLAAGHAAGFDAYLTKPVDLGQLLDTVRALLRRPPRPIRPDPESAR